MSDDKRTFNIAAQGEGDGDKKRSPRISRGARLVAILLAGTAVLLECLTVAEGLIPPVRTIATTIRRLAGGENGDS